MKLLFVLLALTAAYLTSCEAELTACSSGEVIDTHEGRCFLERCNENQEWVKVKGCPMYKIAVGFKLVDDLTKPYPDCCPKVVPDPDYKPEPTERLAILEDRKTV